MATISFSRPVKVNLEWGIKNLMAAMDEEGTHGLSEEKRKELNMYSNVKMTPEMKAKFYKNNGISK